MLSFRSLLGRLRRFDAIDARVERLQEALGRVEARQLAGVVPASLNEVEFRAYSQWGEDGIIQYLIRNVPIDREIFVEFGVEHYTEANTRFLLVNDNWSGLVIDGDAANIAQIRSNRIYWQHNLKAECCFVTRENINAVLTANGIAGDIGLLSIDIDGNDYWVWQAIDVVSPKIVVIEYNARFGPDRAVTIPYDAEFNRSDGHHSMIYYGASLAALAKLGSRKGYSLVGCNSAGNNAFFVRSDCLNDAVRPVAPHKAFVASKFREARDAHGQLTFFSPEQELAVLASLPLVDIVD
jgi:hypothetical protein